MFWWTATANWFGLTLPDTNPELTVESTNGTSPEVIAFANEPNVPVKLRLGVHSFHDHGFGESTATVRVFVHGELVFEGSQLLVWSDLWKVGVLDWQPSPTGGGTASFAPCAGESCVAACYSNPVFDTAVGGVPVKCSK